MKLRACAIALVLLLFTMGCSKAPMTEWTDPESGVTRVPVEFSGGHETDPVDRGRPVVLIAAALGVTPEVFRDAFSRINPAPAGTAPGRNRVRDNKAALMTALGPRGITNDRLDTVSDYYRYSPGRGDLWPTRPARAYALVEHGAVTGYEIQDGGAGYSSTPTVEIPGFEFHGAEVQLSFGTECDHNGSIAAINSNSH